jgi:hypothetical protein
MLEGKWEVITAGSKISLIIRILFLGLQTSIHSSLGPFAFIQIDFQAPLLQTRQKEFRVEQIGQEGMASLVIYLANAPGMHAKCKNVTKTFAMIP